MEAKYPALLFKQQLDTFLQKVYPILRDNVKKEISPQLAACIHAPRQAGAHSARRTTSGGGSGLSPHWAGMLRVFDSLLAMLRQNHVPPFLVQKLFEQLLSFVNVHLFNQLLLRRECCSLSNGEYVKAGLSEVEQWLSAAGEEWVSGVGRGGARWTGQPARAGLVAACLAGDGVVAAHAVGTLPHTCYRRAPSHPALPCRWASRGTRWPTSGRRPPSW